MQIIIYQNKPDSMHTVDTICLEIRIILKITTSICSIHTMKSLSMPRVHIAPVGFEIDRIVEPAIEDKADLVYLILHSNISDDKAKKFADQIIKILKKNRIKSKTVYADRFDLFEIIRVIKEIIQDDRDCEYLINVASGSKIHSIASMMACMIFDDRTNLKPYYAIPERYHSFEQSEQQTYGVKDVQKLPTYRIQTPKPVLIQALSIIKELIEKSNKSYVTKKELVVALEEKKIITVGGETEKGSRLPKNYDKVKYTTLDKKIVKPLKDEWKYIDEEPVGRTRRIFFTDDGIAASKFLF